MSSSLHSGQTQPQLPVPQLSPKGFHKDQQLHVGVGVVDSVVVVVSVTVRVGVTVCGVLGVGVGVGVVVSLGVAVSLGVGVPPQS